MLFFPNSNMLMIIKITKNYIGLKILITRLDAFVQNQLFVLVISLLMMGNISSNKSTICPCLDNKNGDYKFYLQILQFNMKKILQYCHRSKQDVVHGFINQLLFSHLVLALKIVTNQILSLRAQISRLLILSKQISLAPITYQSIIILLI